MGGLSRGSGRLSRGDSWGTPAFRGWVESAPVRAPRRSSQSCACGAGRAQGHGRCQVQETRQEIFCKNRFFSDYESNLQLIKIQKSIRERVGPTRQLLFT